MIELENDLVVGDWVIPQMFMSDGCTMPWFLKLFLAADFFKDECILHDFLRRHIVHYGFITVKHADEYFKGLIRKKSNWFYALLYWIGVRVGRKKYTHTEPFPILEWEDYAHPKSDVWLHLTRGA